MHFGEDPKFMNKRKLEYYELAKKPIFSETLVRVKLPDNWIFECTFAPMEPLGELVNIFHEVFTMLFSTWRTRMSLTTCT